MVRATLILVLSALLASCGLWPPDAIALHDVATRSATGTLRIAAVYVADGRQPFLTEWVVINPDIPAQRSAAQIPITLSAVQQAALPLRVEKGLSYTPLILTATVQTAGKTLVFSDVRDIDTSISEQTVAHNDSNRLIRVIGHLQSPNPFAMLVDRGDPRIALGFAPPWQADNAPVRLMDGAALLVEGVHSGDALIPLVIAPVIDEQ
jgi:hypothetical protein